MALIIKKAKKTSTRLKLLILPGKLRNKKGVSDEISL